MKIRGWYLSQFLPQCQLSLEYYFELSGQTCSIKLLSLSSHISTPCAPRIPDVHPMLRFRSLRVDFIADFYAYIHAVGIFFACSATCLYKYVCLRFLLAIGAANKSRVCISIPGPPPVYTECCVAPSIVRHRAQDY